MLRKIRLAGYFIYGYCIASTRRTISINNIKNRQKNNFKKLISSIADHSHFYNKYKTKALSDFPIIDKSKFLANFNDINTVGLTLDQCEKHALKAENDRDFSPMLNGISVGISSGTSQQRGVFLVSPLEQALWAGYIIAKNIPLSIFKKKVALFLRANSNLYESANGSLINFRFFDLTSKLDQLLKELEQFQPHILIAPAHVLDVISYNQPNIKPIKIISVAEVLEESLKIRLEKQYVCQVDEIYQATEGYIASSCRFGNLHINEDILIVEKEWIDKDTGRFIPIITDLHRRSLPIIRYRLNDILIQETQPCPCGSNFTQLKKIEGREDDILWLPDSNSGALTAIFPDLIRRALYLCETRINEYRLEQDGNRLSIFYESENAKQAKLAITSTLLNLFKNLNVDQPKLLFKLGVDHILINKLRRIACQRKP